MNRTQSPIDGYATEVNQGDGGQGDKTQGRNLISKSNNRKGGCMFPIYVKCSTWKNFAILPNLTKADRNAHQGQAIRIRGELYSEEYKVENQDSKGTILDNERQSGQIPIGSLYQRTTDWNLV